MKFHQLKKTENYYSFFFYTLFICLFYFFFSTLFRSHYQIKKREKHTKEKLRFTRVIIFAEDALQLYMKC